MGFCVILESEDGEPLEQVEDPKNILHQLLPSEDASYQYLRYIDWYGDTVFNRLQIQPFLSEWDRLTESARTSDENALLARVRELALRCSQEPHLYLRFCGD
jgi:hypothetical protein